MKPLRYIGVNIGEKLDSGSPQTPMTVASHFGIGIFEGGNHTCDSRGNDRIRARRRLSVVTARFEGDIEGCALGQRAGFKKRLRLSVRTAAWRCHTTPDNATILDDKRSNRWIWSGKTKALTAQR